MADSNTSVFEWHAYINIYWNISENVHMFIYIYIYIYTHTHTHTHTQ